MTTERPPDYEAMRRAAARAALEFVAGGSVIGVGSGATTWAFVEALGASGLELKGAMAASAETEVSLAEAGIRLLRPDAALHLPVYIDGADEIDRFGRAIKGGGGAHTREKILASWADRWVCIVDERKVVADLAAAVPVEVLPYALSTVRRALAARGATVRLREGFMTDNGNPVLDASGLDLGDAVGLETMLETIPGVVGTGIFAARRADIVIVGRSDGEVARLTPGAPED